MEFLSGVYGPLPNRNLIVIETEAGTPNGYSAPGILFLSPRAIGTEVNTKLVANQVSRQWWGALVSPTTRNHMWIENGMARYAELMYTENISGAGAMEEQVHDTYVEALTVEQPPLMQSARLEDYSPEFWAAHGGQRRGGAAHAALDPGRREFLQAAESRARALRLEIHQHRGFPESGRGGIRPEPQLLLPAMDRIERRAGIQAGIHHLPDVQGIPRERQDLAGPGHVPHAGAPCASTPKAIPRRRKWRWPERPPTSPWRRSASPRMWSLDPKGQLLRYDDDMRVAVAIKRGEQFMEVASTSKPSMNTRRRWT